MEYMQIVSTPWPKTMICFAENVFEVVKTGFSIYIASCGQKLCDVEYVKGLELPNDHFIK
jgi:hypothetical protein